MLLPFANEAGAAQSLPACGGRESPKMPRAPLWTRLGWDRHPVDIIPHGGMMGLEGQRSWTEPAMSITRNVAAILKDHVTLEVEGIDRMYLNVYVPRLQIVEGVLGFIRQHCGHPVPSTRMVEPITRRFVAAIENFIRDRALPLVTFEKGQRQEEVAARLRASFSETEGVVFVGKAQGRSARSIAPSDAAIPAPERSIPASLSPRLW